MFTVNEEMVKTEQGNLTYELTAAHIDDCEDMSYTTYGIRAVDADGKTIVTYPDVNTDQALVQELVDRCNRGQLSPLHLKDVIEDTIGV